MTLDTLMQQNGTLSEFLLLLLYDHTFFKCYIKVAPKFKLQNLRSYYVFKLVKSIITTLLHVFLQRFMKPSMR